VKRRRASKTTSPTILERVAYSVFAFIVSGAIGYGAGVLVGGVVPEKRMSLAGLVVLPLLLLLEILLEVVFEAVTGVFGFHSRWARGAATIGVILGFYVAWFRTQFG
jgi:hypothetical protein